jgi:4-hydroxy-tetrahydrodipicolinate synthase
MMVISRQLDSEGARPMSDQSYHGVLPAMQVPFKPDYTIDEPELRRFAAWLAGTRGITGLVTNGHTGEVFALNAGERAEVTRIVADEVKGRVPVVSGICVESIGEACEHALLAKKAGASALLVMPPHQWLRFGMKPEHVVEHFTEIGKASGLDLSCTCTRPGPEPLTPASCSPSSRGYRG